MREQILAALSQYGSPALFGIVTVAAVGIPLPITLLLIVTGSLVSQGVMGLWWAVGLATAGSVIGDQIGYAIGRWGGRAVVDRFSRLLGGQDRLKQTQAKSLGLGRPGSLLQPMAGHTARPVGEPRQRDRRLSVDAVPFLGCAGRDAGGIHLRDAGPGLQRPRAGDECAAGRSVLGDCGTARRCLDRLETS